MKEAFQIGRQERICPYCGAHGPGNWHFQECETIPGGKELNMINLEEKRVAGHIHV